MVPGKKYKPEDFLAIAWRRKWVILVPLVLIGIGTFVWAQSLPNRYKSEAVIAIIPPTLSSQIAKPIVNEPLAARLDALRQRLLSRTTLERIIQELDLYPELRQTRFMEEVVARMQRDVSLDVAKPAGRRMDPNQFTVSYSSADPRKAMQVAERLASLFVDANLEDRTLRTGSTTTFLDAQLEDSRRRLDEQQKKVENYRLAHNGALPSQTGANLEFIQSSQQQIQTLHDGIGRDSDRRALLEQLVAAAESTSIVTPAPKDSNALTAAQQLEAARVQLRGMQTRLTEDHPDIAIMKRRINELEAKAEAEALQAPVSGSGTAMTADAAARQTRVTQMRSEIAAIDRRNAAARDQIRALEGQIAQRRAFVDAAPTAETELDKLERDLATLQASYDGLLRKSEEARLSSSVEQSQIGEQFRTIDPARLPQRPSGPDRTRFSLLGLGAGLGLGLLLAGLLEYRDTSLRTEDDVIVALSLPVVALVPTMRTAGERRRANRQRMLMASAFVFSIILVATVIVFRSRLVELWNR